MKRYFLMVLMFLLLTFLCACGAPGQTNSDVSNHTEDSSRKATIGEYTVSPYAGITVETVQYDGGYFSLKIPKGWAVKTVGQYFDSGILVYDPQVTERQIFYYCHIVQFLKSEQAKEELARYASADKSYALRADMPVMATGTAEEFFLGYPALLAACDKWNDASGDSSHYPDMTNVAVLEKNSSTVPAPPNCMENSITRISYSTSGGVLCEGLTAQQTIATLDAISPATGNNLGMNHVSSFMGITAKDGELAELESVLTECLCSFSFTDDFVKESVRVSKEQTGAVLAQAAQMNAAYDSYNSAWSARQTSYDIMSQQRSDATLGYERLYDPDTNEVYRAELGFYDSYGADSNLKPVDNSSKDYYLKNVDYYITKP